MQRRDMALVYKPLETSSTDTDNYTATMLNSKILHVPWKMNWRDRHQPYI